MKRPPETEVASVWERALGFWALAVLADRPVFDPSFEGIAAIDLSSRVVTVNPARLDRMKAWGSLEAIFVHELGHHVRHPHTLATLARLEVLQKELLPTHHGSLLNLFTDLLINTEIGRDAKLRDQLCAVYRAEPLPAKAVEHDAPFVFHLVAHEESYRLPAGHLTGPASEALEKAFPGSRAEAQRLVEQLQNLAPNPFTQFIYYASVVSRFLPPPDARRPRRAVVIDPFAGDLPSPGAGDYADALDPGAMEREAIERARREGWIDGSDVRLPDPDQPRAGLPGLLQGKPEVLAEAMAVRYRRLAAKYLLTPPPVPRVTDPFLKTTLLDWEDGDAPQEIDWLATLSARGPQLGVAMPLKRELEADLPGWEAPGVDVRLELYLDVSGSMPDPKLTLNPMTLAAQVLAMSAFRAKGSVRALIYSSNHVAHWEWTRSAATISSFLMNYIGGGTDFPFDVLADSVAACRVRPPTRVVLTDRDFHWNVRGNTWGGEKKPASGGPWRTWLSAVAQSTCVLMLNGTRGHEDWVQELAGSGARIVPVADLKEFPAIAARLGEALFGDASTNKTR